MPTTITFINMFLILSLSYSIIIGCSCGSKDVTHEDSFDNISSDGEITNSDVIDANTITDSRTSDSIMDASILDSNLEDKQSETIDASSEGSESMKDDADLEESQNRLDSDSSEIYDSNDNDSESDSGIDSDTSDRCADKVDSVQVSPSLKASREIQHIINCQVWDPDSLSHGAINDVWGEPTWVVPGEMALAVIALEIMGYHERAFQACEYLASIQQEDGAWCNQYKGVECDSVNSGKSPRHTAQVLMAFYHVGYINEMATNNGFDYLKECIDNSPVPSDGLLNGGLKEDQITWVDDRWLSDNVFAAKAFEYYGYTMEADTIKARVDDQNFFKNPQGYWHQRIDAIGRPIEDYFSWINFAPPNFGLDVVYPSDLGNIIADKLQTDDGAILENASTDKKMPGVGLQTHMALREACGGTEMLNSFYVWLESSGLLHNDIDDNGDQYGIIDWISAGSQAEWWERYIDTSSFVVFNETDFRF